MCGRSCRSSLASPRVPGAFLEAMASLVSRNWGSLMGLSFDADALASCSRTAAKPFIDMARDVAHQVDEDIVRKRAALADHAMSILRALEALAETPEGKGFARDAQLLRSTLGTKKRKQRLPEQVAAPSAPATLTAPAVVITPVKPALSRRTARRPAPTISHRPDRPRRWYPGGGVSCCGAAVACEVGEIVGADRRTSCALPFLRNNPLSGSFSDGFQGRRLVLTDRAQAPPPFVSQGHASHGLPDPYGSSYQARG